MNEANGRGGSAPEFPEHFHFPRDVIVDNELHSLRQNAAYRPGAYKKVINKEQHQEIHQPTALNDPHDHDRLFAIRRFNRVALPALVTKRVSCSGRTDKVE